MSNMNEWLKVSLLLSIFGFLKEIRPSEPFINEFLSGPWKNLTTEQITESVYPVGTYSYLAQSLIVFLITDLLKYKLLIVVLGISGIIVWSLLLWTKSLLEVQIVEVFYGTFMATEVAYFTYIYAKVDKNYYTQVTSHTRAAILAGRAISGLLAQLLVSLDWCDYHSLNYITFSVMLLATLWSLLLPSVKRTIYFHQEQVHQEPFLVKIQHAFKLMKQHFLNSFSNRYVIKWSLWWSLSTCGFIQVQTYMQVLWHEIQNNPNRTLYNGAVEAILTVLSFLVVLLAGQLKIDWKLKGELMLSICSLISGFILLFISRTNYLLICYICYVVFAVIYHFMITINSAEIAKYIEEDSYGLVFGLNTFVSLVLQSILTILFVQGMIGINLTTRNQYFVYGIYHILITVIYIIIGIVHWLTSKRDYRTNL